MLLGYCQLTTGFTGPAVSQTLRFFIKFYEYITIHNCLDERTAIVCLTD